MRGQIPHYVDIIAQRPEVGPARINIIDFTQFVSLNKPAQFIYIIDENNHLIGYTNFRRLILTNSADPIQNAALTKVYSVRLDSGVKEVAYLMEKYKYYSIAVVDEKNVLQGIITVDDILSQVIAIAWRRLSRKGGIPPHRK